MIHISLQPPPELFDYLLKLLKLFITKETKRFREPIQADMRLSSTLRYLISCEIQQSLAWLYRIEKQTVSKILQQLRKFLLQYI